jgi:hypothetical protein
MIRKLLMLAGTAEGGHLNLAGEVAAVIGAGEASGWP